MADTTTGFFRLSWRARAAAIAAMGLVLGGCAGFNGVQDPIKSPDLATTICPDSSQLVAFASTSNEGRGGLAPKDFRDSVINNCINAINTKFYDFTKRLRIESTSTKLGADLATLTLAGLAATGNGAKNSAAAIEGLVGAGAAINKDIYFDQTLPALVSAMIINRNDVLKRIRAAQRREASDYTLGEAGSDLWDLQNASNVDAAIKQLITVAQTKEKITSDEVLPPPKIVSEVRPANLQDSLVEIVKYVDDHATANDLDTLKPIAKAVGMTDADIAGLDAAALDKKIVVALNNIADTDGLDGLRSKLGTTVPAEVWK